MAGQHTHRAAHTRYDRAVPKATQPEPRDPIEDDIAEALAHPEFRAWLDEDLAREERGEEEPTYSTEEVWAHLEEDRRRRRLGLARPLNLD